MDASAITDVIQPLKIFYIYAPRDKATCEELDIYLAPLKNSSPPRIETWDTHNVPLGSEHKRKIYQELDQADIILVFVSSNYNADSDCQEYTNKALEQKEQREAHVIPLYVNSKNAVNNKLNALSGIPRNEKVIRDWSRQKRGEVYEAVKQSIEEIAANRIARGTPLPSAATTTELHPSPEPPAIQSPANPTAILSPTPLASSRTGDLPTISQVTVQYTAPFVREEQATTVASEPTPKPTPPQNKTRHLWPRKDAIIRGASIAILFVALLGANYFSYQRGYRVGYTAPHTPPPIINTHMVMNMNSSGSGSFTDIIEHAKYGDAIMFKTGLSGTIDFLQDLEIKTAITIIGNSAITLSNNDKGYRIHIDQGTHVSIENLTFSNNDSERAGNNYHNGFIFNEGGELTFSSCNFKNNSSTYNGGVIYNKLGSITIEDSTFIGNTANNNGGALYNLRGQVSISNSSFQTNRAAIDGGSIFNLAGAVTLTNNSNIVNNQTQNNDGGGIESRNGILIVSDSSVTDNTVPGDGGGILVAGGLAQFSSTLISDNTAGKRGGGLAIEPDPDNSQPATVFFTTALADIAANKLSSGQNDDIWGTSAINEHEAEFISKVIGNNQYLPELTPQFMGNADISKYCRDHGYLGISSQSNPWDLQCWDAVQGRSVSINDPGNFAGANAKDPIQAICMQQYSNNKRSLSGVIDRLANNDDPTSWQCYKDESLEGNITTDYYPGTQITYLAWYCSHLYGQGSKAITVGTTAYDWKCQEVSGIQQGIDMADACVQAYGVPDAVDRFTDYNNNIWQCWVPATHISNVGPPSTAPAPAASPTTAAPA